MLSRLPVSAFVRNAAFSLIALAPFAAAAQSLAPATNVGSSTTQTATVTVATAGTVSALNVLTKGAPNLDFKFISGGNCTVGTAYNIGDTCTVNYAFAPTAPGLRYGAITFSDAAGNTLAQTSVTGTGVSPQIVFPTPTPVSVSPDIIGGYHAVATDALGNVYAGIGGGIVYKLATVNGAIPATPTVTAVADTGDGAIIQGLALDGAGNLFVNTSNDGDIYEFYAVNGVLPANPTPHLLSNNALGGAMVFDLKGNLYVTDGGHGSLNRYSPVDGYTNADVFYDGFTLGYPTGVTVDTAGNVYVACINSGDVREFLATNGVVPDGTSSIKLATGLSQPAGLTIDPAGNLYVGLLGPGQIIELQAVNGAMPATPNVVTYNAAISQPFALAFDDRGSLYSGGSGPLLQLPAGATPTIAFPYYTALGSTSSPVSLTVTNQGNADLIFSVPSSGTNPAIAPTAFAITGGTCPALTSSSTAFTLTSGLSCTDTLTFTPAVHGTTTGTLTFTDNNSGANSTQSVLLTGPSPYVPTITVTPVTNTLGVDTTVLTASIAFDGPVAPTGAVTFTVDGTTIINGNCTGASSPLVCKGNYSSGGQVSGPHAFNASIASDANYASATSADSTATLTQVTVTVHVGNYTADNVSSSVSVVAGFAYTSNRYVTGNVSFQIDALPPVVAFCDMTNCSATLPIAGLATGSHTLKLSYPGDTRTAAASGSGTLTILAISSAAPVTVVGATSATQTATLNISTAGTLDSINVLTQGASNLDFKLVAGGTCATGTSYNAGDSCTVSYTFTPTVPGVRYGAITLSNSSGYLSQLALSGQGTGPQIVFPTATSTTIGQSLFIGYHAIATDALGNVYAGFGSGLVYKAAAVNGVVSSTSTITVAANTNDNAIIQGLAVDGAGNLFVNTNNDGDICEFYAINGVLPDNPTPHLLSNNSLGGAMAFAPNGILYVTDGPHGSMSSFSPADGYTNATTYYDGFTMGYPTGVAVDAAGDVFVASQNSGNVREFVATNGVTSNSVPAVVLVTGLDHPAGVALDPAGNLYVGLLGPGQIVELQAVNNVMPATPNVITYNASVPQPFALTFDAAGSLYSAGTGNLYQFANGVVPNVTFPLTLLGNTSAPVSFSIANNGTSDLIFSTPTSGSNPTITSSAFTNTGTGTCPTLIGSSTAYALSSGNSCTETLTFTPATNGTNTGSMIFTDNATGAGSTQSVTLTGPSPYLPNLVAQSVTNTLGVDNTTLTATLAYNGPSAPTGAVTFSIDGTDTVTATCTGSASPLTCTGSYSSGSKTSGAHVLTASIAGDANYVAATSANATLTLTQVTITITVGTFSTDTVTSNVSVTGGFAYTSNRTPTGNIYFQVDSFTPVAASCNNVNCSVSLPTGGIPGGTHVLKLFYAGDTRFAAASGSGTLNITSAGDKAPVTNLGSTSAMQTSTITINTAGTPDTINVLTQGASNLDFKFVAGGTCATGTAYNAGDSCTVNYTFSPTAPGLRLGAITLSNSSGYLAQKALSGQGVGPQIAFPTATPIAIASGQISGYHAVATDGLGNVYAGMGNGQIYKVAAVNGVVSATATVTAAANTGDNAIIQEMTFDGAGNLFVNSNNDGDVYVFYAVNGVLPANPTPHLLSNNNLGGAMAFDANGSLYITDGPHGSLNRYSPIDGYTNATVFYDGFTLGYPTGVVADAAGNVYVTGQNGGEVREFVAVNGIISNTVPAINLATGLDHPSGLAIDPAGNLYVGLLNASTILQLQAVNGVMPATPNIVTYNSSVPTPYALTMDSNGNLYAVGSGNLFRLDVSPSLTFSVAAVNTTSATQTINLVNQGNADIVLSVPASGTNPAITVPFATTTGTTCPSLTPTSSSSTFAIGASCTVAINYAPAKGGSITETYAFTGNLPAGSGGITLTGSAPASASITVPTANVAYHSTPATLTASISYNGYTPPTGAMTFKVDSGTAFAGVCTGSSSPVTCTASYDSSASTATTHTITASLASDASYAAASNTGSLVVTAPALTITVTPQTVGFGSTTATLTASVAYAAAMPTTAFTFQVDTGTAVTATCTGSSSPLTCTAIYNVSSLNAGAHTITGAFAGDNVYPPSTGTATLTVGAALNPVIVDTTADSAVGANCGTGHAIGTCDLRTAMNYAMAAAVSGETVSFDSTVFATAQTITTATALPTVTGTTSTGVNIVGPVNVSGAPLVTIVGRFVLNSGVNALTNLIITGGSGTTGGCIMSGANITITNVTVDSCTATSNGGGIYAFLLGQNPTMTIVNSTISNNTSGGSGGGLYINGIATVTGTTIYGNTASVSGGGVSEQSGKVAVNFTNDTITGNTVVSGTGGGFNYAGSGSETFNNLTITGNTAGATGSKVANDASIGTRTIGANNIISACIGTCTSNFAAATLLSPLGNYGGVTKTIIPLPGSSALGTGTTCTTNKDARGYTRPTTGACDFGATQTSYALSWTTQPPSSTPPATDFTAGITITENGNALSFPTAQTVSIPVTLTTSGTGSLSGSPMTSLSTTGVASGTFQVSSSATSNTLTAAAGTATAVSSNFLVGLVPQTITFTQPASPITFTAGVNEDLVATSSAGLPVTFTVTGPTHGATITGSNIVFSQVGFFSVTASQAGDSTHSAAPNVTYTVEVDQAATSVAVGHASAPQTVTMTFTTSFTLGSISLSTMGGSGSNDLSIPNHSGSTCQAGVTYNPGDSCTVVVVLTPSGPGLIVGNISILDQSSTVQDSVSLSSLGFR